MIDAHRTLGVLLVIVYAAIAILAFVIAGRQGEHLGRGLPNWLTGTVHALLGVQVLLGVVLIVRYPHAVPASHAVAGLTTLAALALMVPLWRRYGRLRALGASALIVAVLAVTAAAIALSG